MGQSIGGFPGEFIIVAFTLPLGNGENSAGVVIDALRYLKVARELGIVGALRGPSAWTQKSPPEQMYYSEAKAECIALADRELTHITSRQLTKEDALSYMKSQLDSNSTSHLKRLEE